ncbi:proliferating cell nuclear antigen (pcna) [archaeon]|nr:proliferating cell nuclear antigen (pcna) [archaeon]
MKLELSDSNSFKRSIEGINALVGEACFVVDAKGMSLKATDPSNISMIEFFMPKTAFTLFDLDKETRLGLDLDYLAQISRRARADDKIVLELDEEKNSLILKFIGKTKRKFAVPLIDVSNQCIPSLKIDFDAELECPAALIQEGLKDAQLISTHVILGADKEGFFIKAHSTKGNLVSETPKSDLSRHDIKDGAEAMFPLDYLNDMLKTASNDSKVTLNLKTDAPVRLSYAVGQATLTYFLAPRAMEK